jgi:hypothetical protein
MGAPAGSYQALLFQVVDFVG